MLSRIDILKRSDLPNRVAFDTEPYRDEFGILRIKFSSPGDPVILLTLGVRSTGKTPIGYREDLIGILDLLRCQAHGSKESTRDRTGEGQV